METLLLIKQHTTHACSKKIKAQIEKARTLRRRMANDTTISCKDDDVTLYLELYWVLVALSSVAVVVCLCAITCLFRLKLLRKVVYRMAFYQTLCALAYSVSIILQLSLFAIHKHVTVTNGTLCSAASLPST